MIDDDLSPARFGTIFKRFMEAVVAEATPPSSPLLARIHSHLGTDPTHLPVVAEEFDAFEHPNVQVGIDAYLSGDGRQAALVGIAADNKRYLTLGLSDLVSRGGLMGRSQFADGPVDYINFHLDGGRVLSCVQFGLYLVSDGEARLVILVTGPSEGMGPRLRVRVEVMSARQDDAQTFLVELNDNMRRLNVYRGHVISLAPGRMGMGPQTLVAFHTLPTIAREDVILPAGVIDRVERHTIVFAEHAERLRAAGRSLKRGLLMYGLPGTGKTLTVMYLIGRMPGRTVILTTGLGMGLLQTVAYMARVLAPSMVVLEDVDLIAEERGQAYGRTGPLLFELLNEMDGLHDDCDVIFVLTTNRPDILEPALAARPGRIDLAIELPLPDAEGRRRLLELYARGLELRDANLDALVERTEGVSPAYIKELLRKSALLAVAEGDGVVTDAHLEAAMTELSEGGRLAQRLLGYRPVLEPTSIGATMPLPPMPSPGFPATSTEIQEVDQSPETTSSE